MWQKFIGVLNNHSTLIVGLATIVLVIITFFYLLETKRLRRIAEKSMDLELAPKVFLQPPTSSASLNDRAKQLEINTVLELANVGKTEATNVYAEIELVSGDEKFEDKIGPEPYLYPTERRLYSLQIMAIRLSDENLAKLRAAVDEQMAVSIRKDLMQPVSMSAVIHFMDHEGKEKTLHYAYQYELHTNTWTVSPQ